ncbi:arpin [Hemicordylus capensis]|uniref:arpin n=1 Tax=Hemicordylus capensis TaxID=884348 RepID=UPI0023033F6D|nr:arpin [Hemicordylus capensis]
MAGEAQGEGWDGLTTPCHPQEQDPSRSECGAVRLTLRTLHATSSVQFPPLCWWSSAGFSLMPSPAPPPRALLRAKPVHRERLPQSSRWDPPAWQRGNGVLVEGELLDGSRHLILDAANRKGRYFVLYVRPTLIHRRRFDSEGQEVEPNFSQTRKVTTGFLMASYKVEAKGSTDRLTLEELECLVGKPELAKMTQPHTPSQAVAFWLPESEMERMELEVGTQVRLKTLGDSPFVFSLAKLEAGTVTKCNFAGEQQAGASWTDNIFANKQHGELAGEPRGPGDGAEDAEWED